MLGDHSWYLAGPSSSIDVTERQQQHAVKPTELGLWRVVSGGVFRPLLDSCRMTNLPAYYTSHLVRNKL